MIANATGDYEVDRQRHVQALEAGLGGEVERVVASREQQHALRDERLRALLSHARAHSPWHRERLHPVDIDSLSAADLTGIGPMTKSDLMANWNEIVCDRDLSLNLANDHIDRIGTDGPSYLLDTYHAAATGGTTGHRAVMVWDFEGLRLSASRLYAWGLTVGGIAPPFTVVNIGSVGSNHMGGAITRCFSNPELTRTVSLSASLPIGELIAQLEEIQPEVLVGYASMLHELSLQKLAGRLRIEPQAVSQGGESFLPEAREAVAKAFPVATRDIWGSTEVGFGASSFPGYDGLVVSEDLVIIEAVDSEGRPVSEGERSAKLFVTNLTNRVLPIIRYEITDEVTLAPPAPGCPWQGHRMMTIHGRQDDVFRYGEGLVHPHTFRSVLSRQAKVAEYQVTQTKEGAHVRIVGADGLLVARLEGELATALERAGLQDPKVRVEVVPSIERHERSKKLKRFIPL